MTYIRLFVAAVAIATVGLSLGGTTSYAGGSGQTFAVTRGDDPPIEGCQPGDCTLREAILAANANPGRDTVTIPAITVTLSIAGTEEDADQTGDLDITDDVTIEGAGVGKTIINGGQIDRVFDVPSPGGDTPSDAEVTIQDLNVMGGNHSGIRNTGDLLLSHVTVLANSNAVEDGGGVFSPLGSLTVNNSTIFKNSSSHSGGGILADGDLFMDGSTVYANSANDAGGGVFADGYLSMVNTTVNGNHVTSGHGGGVSAGPAVTYITNSTITDNTSSGTGGGLSASGEDMTVSNTIISGNTGGTAPDCSGTLLGNNNLVKNPTGCTLDGTDNVTGQDPMLFALANYGGSTQTRAIPDTSPAFDGGDIPSCPDTDQRGVPRTQVNACDIGSYELTYVGDIDCSGVVAGPDISALLGGIAGSVIPECFYRGDIDCNLAYNGFDILFLLRHIAHLTEMTRPLYCPAIGPDGVG